MASTIKAEVTGLFGAGLVEVAVLMPASTSGFAKRARLS